MILQWDGLKTEESNSTSVIPEIIIYSLIFFIHYWFITYGSLNILGGEYQSSAYDYMGQNLLHGSGETVIDWEAFIVDGKTYTYYGPFPAVIRIILNAIFPVFFGLWGRLACFLSFILSMIAFSKITSEVLNANNNLDEKNKKNLSRLFILSFGLGTPMLFLMSAGHIYHEAILWGFSGSLWGVYFLIKFLFNPDDYKHSVPWLSFVAGCALLARATFGFPFYLILFLIVVSIFAHGFENKITQKLKLVKIKGLPKSKISLIKTIFIITSPAILMLSMQLWYNNERFKSPFTFIDMEYYMPYSPEDLEKYRREGLTNTKFLVPSLINYLGVRKEYLSEGIKLLKPVHMEGRYREEILSLSVASPWILMVAIFGLLILFKERDFLLAKLCVPILSLEIYVLMTLYFITHRYTIDFFPVFMFLYVFFLRDIGSGNFPVKEGIGKFYFLKILCLWSILITFVTTLNFAAYNVYTPEEQREKLQKIFTKV